MSLKPEWPIASRSPARRAAAVALLGVGLAAVAALANPAVEYATGFEPPEFQPDSALVPQGGWTANAFGSDMIVSEFFSGGGQQALLGYFQPEGAPSSVSLLRPLNLDPLASGRAVVTFQVSFAIYDCSTTNRAFRDFFRWSVWSPTNRLFALEFDNTTGEIAYGLDDDEGVFVSTGTSFERADAAQGTGLYDLAITMDFLLNRWSAALNDTVVVAAQPISTRGAPRILGDIDAVWVKAQPQRFGDDYLVFDGYQVRSDTAAAQPFRLEPLGRFPGGFALRLRGEEGARYAIDASTAFRGWSPLKTNTVSGGYFDFVDDQAAALGARFYRARTVVP
jgi:hypothetical protein